MIEEKNHAVGECTDKKAEAHGNSFPGKLILSMDKRWDSNLAV